MIGLVMFINFSKNGQTHPQIFKFLFKTENSPTPFYLVIVQDLMGPKIWT